MTDLSTHIDVALENTANAEAEIARLENAQGQYLADMLQARQGSQAFANAQARLNSDHQQPALRGMD